MNEPSSSVLAKLTRPRLYDVVLRERLFDVLDRARERRRAIFVVGPPGSGKTTLVASWLDDRNLSGIWMQLDPGDADLATFFYYLGQAASGTDRQGRRRLPMLTPEYLGDVSGFSRRFFRELFARMPAGATLVLDNYQEIPSEHALHGLIAQAVDEVPAGANLLLISRVEPPESQARMIANGNVAIVDWTELRLSTEEARRICAQRSRVKPSEIDRLFIDCGGWVAGLTLMLERATKTDSFDAPDMATPPQRIFDYFATQVFSEASQTNREILCKLALAPRLSARLANALIGDAAAGRLLGTLYRRNLFTDRRGGESGTYTFHALFRAFLLHKASDFLSKNEIKSIQHHAAQLLEGESLIEDAMELYLESHDYQSAARMFVSHAAQLLAAGRWITITEWCKQLPAEVVDDNPWVRYWLGAAHVAVSPSQARHHLAHAHAKACDQGDTLCRIQSAAAIIESCCIEWSRFSLMDPWIPELERAIDETISWATPDARLRAMNALLSALAYRAPEHKLLPLCVERTLALLPSASDANIKVVAASTLTNHGGHSAQPRTVRAGLAQLHRWIDDPLITMPNRAAGLFSLVWGHHFLREATAAREALVALEQLVEDTGLVYAGTFSAFMGSSVEGCHGSIGAARQWFELLSQRINPARWYDRAIYCCAAVYLGMYERDPQLAMTYGDEGIALIADGVANSAIQWRYPVAVAHARRGDRTAMRRLLSEIRELSQRHQLQYWGPLCRAAEAIGALQQDDENELRRALTDMLRLSRMFEETLLWFLKADLPDLLSVALAEGIDPDEVRRLIRMYDLPAPSPLAENWPWLVAVRALGPFSLEVGGSTLEFKGKIPKKPIAVLKALICMGGCEVSISRLADAIWPDMDGDDATRAFHTALYRLRALLQHEDVLILSDGKLTIDRKRVWVDALAFRDLCLESQAGNLAATHRALGLYRGSLLQDEPDAQWAISARARLAQEHRLLADRLTRAHSA